MSRFSCAYDAPCSMLYCYFEMVLFLLAVGSVVVYYCSSCSCLDHVHVLKHMLVVFLSIYDHVCILHSQIFASFSLTHHLYLCILPICKFYCNSVNLNVLAHIQCIIGVSRSISIKLRFAPLTVRIKTTRSV